MTTKPKTTSVAEGATKKVTATVEPAEAIQTVTWSSDAEKTATVDEDGTIHGVKAGKCKVKATTVNGLTADVDVTVTTSVVPEA